MKKVMLIALMGMFSLAMFAQNQDKAKPAVTKKEPAKTEQATQTAGTAAKESKPITSTKKSAKHSGKKAMKPADKKAEAAPKK